MKRLLTIAILMLAACAVRAQDIAPILPGERSIERSETPAMPAPRDIAEKASRSDNTIDLVNPFSVADVEPVFYAADVSAKCYAQVVDYTSGSFLDAIMHEHSQSRTAVVAFVDREGVAPVFGWSQFYGNVLVVTFGAFQKLRNNNDACTSRLWIDWAAHMDDPRWFVMPATLANSESIAITYDPECGLITDIQILTWRSR